MTEHLVVGHDRIAIHLTGDTLVADVVLPPGGGPPMLHRHASTEVYRVCDGELAIYRAQAGDAIERIVAGPGDVVVLPGNIEHTVRNESAAAAEAYVVFTPGEPAERFLRACARLADAGGAPDIAEVLATAERHGVRITRPIPAAAGRTPPRQ
jgi:mannose-6-phosphate isomerase-like protein (cupin superfamily)